MAFFSIITPIYNVQEYLPSYFDSLKNQDFKDFEVILVDDGSTDMSYKIAYEQSQKDNHFKLLSQENLGPGAARNKALKFIKDEEGFLLFIDSDDSIEPTLFSNLYNTLNTKAKQAELLLMNYNYTTDEGNLIKSRASHLLRHFYDNRILHSQEFIRLVNTKPMLITTTIHFVIKKSLISKIPSFPTNILYEDVYFGTYVVQMVKQIYISDISDYNYRQSTNSIMRGKVNKNKLNESMKSYMYLVKHFFSLYKDLQDHPSIHPETLLLYKNTAKYCLLSLINNLRKYGFTSQDVVNLREIYSYKELLSIKDIIEVLLYHPILYRYAPKKYKTKV